MPENNFLKDFSRIFEEKSKIDENSLLDPLGFIIGGEIKKECIQLSPILSGQVYLKPGQTL
ncbi:MAG: hypothetical protein PHI15_04710 [Methanomicrobium sp.]|nr:hypothetical protein [Methanomicrobium sp.]